MGRSYQDFLRRARLCQIALVDGHVCSQDRQQEPAGLPFLGCAPGRTQHQMTCRLPGWLPPITPVLWLTES